MKIQAFLGLLLSLTCVAGVGADPPVASTQHGWPRWWLAKPLCPPIGYGPDDYARKPMPSTCPTRCGGKDDYAHKPLPCVPRTPCGGPDDYNRKTLPCVLCPWVPQNAQCGTPVVESR